ncbi:hypothetical protein BX616_001851, partial [Lobosporangium transversale]
VLILIFLDFCKNAAFFAKQVGNLTPSTPTTTGDGQLILRPRDPAYLAAQYIYATWLMMMMIKAVIGFRANLKFNVRWMSIYNVLLGLDTGFEFVHTTLGVLFQDMSQLDEAGIIRHYCVSYLILILQLYGFFCCWIHLKWVNIEMPHLFAADRPPQSLLGLMFPMAISSRRRINGPMGAVATEGADVVDLESVVVGSSSNAAVTTEPTATATAATTTSTTMPALTPTSTSIRAIPDSQQEPSQLSIDTVNHNQQSIVEPLQATPGGRRTIDSDEIEVAV